MSGRDYGQRNFSYVPIFSSGPWHRWYSLVTSASPKYDIGRLLFIYFVSISISVYYMLRRGSAVTRYPGVCTFEDCVHEIVWSIKSFSKRFPHVFAYSIENLNKSIVLTDSIKYDIFYRIIKKKPTFKWDCWNEHETIYKICGFLCLINYVFN